MFIFIMTMFACSEDENADSGTDDTAVEEVEVEPTVRYH